VNENKKKYKKFKITNALRDFTGNIDFIYGLLFIFVFLSLENSLILFIKKYFRATTISFEQ